MQKRMRLTRELVERLPARIEDPGPIPLQDKLEPKGYHERIANRIVREVPHGDGLWIFAFGSLIWKPRFHFIESRRAVVRGWHRKFCLGSDVRYRGNPEAPGLMLSLVEGGECEGIVFRLPSDRLKANLLPVLKTEPPIPPVWVDAETDQGNVRSIAFVCPKGFPAHVEGLDEAQTADRLSAAVGMWGSMPDYLYNTICHLEEIGIHDPYLWRMQELVAKRLERLPPRQPEQ